MFFGLTELKYTERSYRKHSRLLKKAIDGHYPYYEWYFIAQKLKRVEARLIWLWNKKKIDRKIEDLYD